MFNFSVLVLISTRDSGGGFRTVGCVARPGIKRRDGASGKALGRSLPLKYHLANPEPPARTTERRIWSGLMAGVDQRHGVSRKGRGLAQNASRRSARSGFHRRRRYDNHWDNMCSVAPFGSCLELQLVRFVTDNPRPSASEHPGVHLNMNGCDLFVGVAIGRLG